jgi:hypothetical protein
VVSLHILPISIILGEKPKAVATAEVDLLVGFDDDSDEVVGFLDLVGVVEVEGLEINLYSFKPYLDTSIFFLLPSHLE